MKIVLIGYIWPEHTSSAAGVRDFQILKAFLNQNHQVHCLSASKESTFSKELNQLGVITQTVILNHSQFDETIKSIQPDLVIFDRFVTEEQFGSRVRASCPQALRVIDTQDLHFLRRARQLSFEKNVPLDFRTEDAIREISAIYRSDLTLIISDFEYALLQSEFQVPKNLLHLCRFFYPARTHVPSFEGRKNICFIGNFRHPPNFDAVSWLHKDLWSKIKTAIPEAELHIYGAYPPQKASEMHNPSKGFFIKGQTIDAISTLSHYKLSLAPLRFGAGIKGKISDSWMAGTPVISTPLGAEGMIDSHPFGGIIAQSAEEFASKCQYLYTSAEHWSNSQSQCFKLVDTLYSETKTIPLLINQLEQAKINQEINRESNWIGKMLWYHGNRSTEYFSKWIELKNKPLIL